MKLSELLQFDVTIKEDCEFTGIQNDSRIVNQGDLFIAYPGADADGRDYIHQAFEKGAAAVIYECSDGLVYENSTNKPCIPVSNVAAKCALYASRLYNFPGKELLITGITGTNGKTTVAYLLAQAYHLLEAKSAYIGTLGEGEINHINNLPNTTPDAICLQKLLNEYKRRQINYVTMEVSSHALSQGRTDEIPFKQAIFTNLSHEHLDYHKTMEQYAMAKAKLFSTPGLEWAIVNKDDPHHQNMLSSLSSSAKVLTYGLQTKSDVQALRWHSTMKGSEVEVSSPWGTYNLSVNGIGEFNIYNSLAVFASLLTSGLDVHDVLSIMPHLKPVPGRMEVVAEHPMVIVDFAHTPDALIHVLQTLSHLKKQKLIVVFGCGGDRDKSKRKPMGVAAAQYADEIWITSDNPRHENPETIINEIAEGLTEHQGIHKVVSRRKAIEQALSQAGEEDIVLIAGKGHEPYQQIGDKKFPFSDQNIVREYSRSLSQKIR